MMVKPFYFSSINFFYEKTGQLHCWASHQVTRRMVLEALANSTRHSRQGNDGLLIEGYTKTGHLLHVIARIDRQDKNALFVITAYRPGFQTQ